MPAALALHPVLLSAPTPEMCLARLEGISNGVGIHPSHHQHAPSAFLLNNGRDEAIIVKFQVVDKRHALGLPQGPVAAQEKRSETG